MADSVAYINHDIGDAIRAGAIVESDLPKEAISVLGHSSSARINTMVCDIIDQSWSSTGLGEDKKPAIAMSSDVLEAANILRRFLFDRVYEVQTALEQTERARQVVRFLYNYLINNPESLPIEYKIGNDIERGVVDYIAGMTDNYALRLSHEQGILSLKE